MEGTLGQVLNACVMAIGLGVVLKWLLQQKSKGGEKEEGPMAALATRLFSFFKRQKQEENPLRILGSLALGLREKVFLVEAEGRRFLLSVNRGGVSVLYAFEAKMAQGSEVRAKEEPKGQKAYQEAQDLAFPFPLPFEKEDPDGSRLRPFGEMVRELEREYPFLKEMEGWER